MPLPPSLDLQELECVETCRWVREKLDSLEALVIAHSSDPELLEVIEFLRDDNESWTTPAIEEQIEQGKLSLGSDRALPTSCN